MKINKAISIKITKILRENDLTVNQLANICCLTQSTVDSLASGKSKNPKLLTIIRLCDGLNISIAEFFTDECFKSIDRED